jgi:hypothetical protein
MSFADPTDDSPYSDGYDAAWRRGRWEHYKAIRKIPANPHLAGTPEHADWARGFDEGADDHWEAWKAGEA